MKQVLCLMIGLMVSGCAWYPFMPSPGGTKFKMTPEGAMDLETNGVNRDRISGEATFPNGASIKIRMTGQNASDAAIASGEIQTRNNLALIALLQQIMTPANFAKVLPALMGVPVVP